MRVKTHYAERPADHEVISGDEGQSVVVFRLNIEETETVEGTAFAADEYRLLVNTTPNLLERVEQNTEAWISRAVADDFAREAAFIREARDRLLAESDWTQAADSPLPQIKKEAWAAYRQELRDIPSDPGFPYEVAFPRVPV